jgi:hypothetical protein
MEHVDGKMLSLLLVAKLKVKTRKKEFFLSFLFLVDTLENFSLSFFFSICKASQTTFSTLSEKRTNKQGAKKSFPFAKKFSIN